MKVTGFVFRIVFMLFFVFCGALEVASVGSVVSDMIKKKDWESSAAAITFIGTPVGEVYGSFTDERGVFHENVYMYRDGKFMSIRAVITGEDPEPYIGTQVRITYDPSTLDEYIKIEEYEDTRVKIYNIIVYIKNLIACASMVWFLIYIGDYKYGKRSVRDR